ncbi:MAG: acyl carrier protein [Propionivibrio sp.]|uniref:Acyl carrier protein n=1 Tax=Candidatus Propionivibrio dominans TaxID=2954373 RepID=A0A9D7IA84_9RHOO|nr:acyl carrier protein [Candidatus Propionivibrio dominans]
MEVDAKQKLREFLKKALENHRDHKEFADSESLFVSGRLDSFSMMTLVMYLEEAFGLDFSDFEFDVNLVDTVNEIELLIDSKMAA